MTEKIKVLLLYGFIVVLAGGCRSVERQVATSEQQAILTKLDALALQVNESHTETDLARYLREQERLNIVVTEYHLPDSTGHQAIKQTTVIERERSEDREEREETRVDESAEIVEQTHGQSSAEISHSTEESVDKSSVMPNLKFILTIGIFLLFALFLYKHRQWLS